MPREHRFDILFEPIRIGPVTARNRFYQVPHCNGMGYLRPDALSAMRGVKAEGGWAVVCTEETSIHPSSDFGGFAEGRLWDDADIPALARMTEAVHAHGALAGFQPVHGGYDCHNASTRLPSIAPSDITVKHNYPAQARAMDASDIRAYRRWHRDAVVRAKRAGFDLVYVYAAHNLSLPMQFLSHRFNQRNDEYGGSLENRARLLKQILEDTHEAVGDSCAVALRFSVEEFLGGDGMIYKEEGRELVEMFAEVPDLWDVNISDFSNDAPTSLFEKSGHQEQYVSFVKSLTSKPVVGVGRFTSPDEMLALVRGGVLDLIGAARPSIADPYLPKKIEEGPIDEICECIGCNLCIAMDNLASPIRCTQNPTMGEEWRRGWHPERIEPKRSDDRVLVVGAGPAGLECALALGRRGYPVTLAEASRELGGRVTRESALPGLSEWGRVRDYRVALLEKLANVEVFRESRLDADDVRELGAPHVLIATGASWRRDGVGRQHRWPIDGLEKTQVFSPDDVMQDRMPAGRVVVYDDDHYYMASVLAEKLRAAGCQVVLATPDAEIASWTHHTLDHDRILARLIERGVELRTSQKISEVRKEELEMSCVYTDRRSALPCDALVLVTQREPDIALYLAPDAESGVLRSLRRVGDCLVPGIIAQAVWDGHRAAREFESDTDDDLRFKHEYMRLEPR